MSKPILLPLEAPLPAIAEAAGITIAELGRRRRVTDQSARGAVKRGDGLTLKALRAWAKAAGYDIEVSIKKIDG